MTAPAPSQEQTLQRTEQGSVPPISPRGPRRCRKKTLSSLQDMMLDVETDRTHVLSPNTPNSATRFKKKTRVKTRSSLEALMADSPAPPLTQSSTSSGKEAAAANVEESLYLPLPAVDTTAMANLTSVFKRSPIPEDDTKTSSAIASEQTNDTQEEHCNHKTTCAANVSFSTDEEEENEETPSDALEAECTRLLPRVSPLWQDI